MDERNRITSIALPETDNIFRGLKNAKRFAIDIGGSLTKLAYYSTVSYKRTRLYSVEECAGLSGEEDACSEIEELNEEQAKLHFVKFETKYIETCLDFIKQNLLGSPATNFVKTIKVTGGGAYKYSNLLSKLGLTIDKEDEIACLISGCNFLLRNIPGEVFTFDYHGDPQYKFCNVEPNIFPYMLVNIGSGVSIMKVETDNKYERIGGTSLGGGTFWGLGQLLTHTKSFNELLRLASEGDHRNVDMLVKDIYSGDYSQVNLAGDVIASSFGKATNLSHNSDSEKKLYSEADIARSLLLMVSNDIGQIASLYAMMHGLNNIYFGGYFLRHHPVSMHTITYAINYWSKGKVNALFLRHEGYLGAIGAYLRGVGTADHEKSSWGENLAGSSGLASPIPAQNLSSENETVIDQLEMDSYNKKLVYCPLLTDPGEYCPDTDDLTKDVDARNYWLDCFQNGIDDFAKKIVMSQPGSLTASDRAEKFKQKYSSRLDLLRNQPFLYGILSVRVLLHTREHYMNEFQFLDPYLQQKHTENELAMKFLSARLQMLERMPWIDRQTEIVKGILAGNVFDWGAKEIVKLFQESNFGFQEALKKLPDRPWLQDGFNQWILQLKENCAYKCAAIFVDNSGADIVLGIFPFVVELLKNKTKVLLCANSKPALNDVTHYELQVLVKQAANFSEIMHQALINNNLLVMDSGQGSPCLDLSRLSSEVANEMINSKTDLIVLEGMGRAIHTNLEAKFSCDIIKAAVLKNHWLANRLEGKLFDVIFKFEPKRR
ncbi:Pantothenate kinase 4 [Nymphon striatum]|nr:Pantothenate kinase 4 [Nymphon striatum]